jgi:hypothetical protein
MSVALVTLSAMREELPASLSALVRIQHGVFSRKQALRAGFTRNAIDARVRHRTWRSIHPGVYTTLTGEPGTHARLWAVLLYAGRGAVLSHETAAWLHGLERGTRRRRADEQVDVIHVTIPIERRVAGIPGVQLHRSARVFRAALADTDPPRTRLEDTLLDLTDTARTFDDACGWVIAAVSQELTDESRLLAAMARRSKMRWRAELREVVAASMAGDHSVLEFRYTRDVERRHGLPEARRQVPFRTPDGRRGRHDRAYIDYRVIIEIDGRVGHEGENVRQDRARDRAAAVAGKQTLRFGSTEVWDKPCDTAVEVALVLRDRGWTGRPRPCSLHCRVRYAFPG